MSKEYLEALDWLLANEMIYRGRTRLPISPALRDIKHRLESIDNANPSEALECLENIEANLTGLPKHVTEYDDIFDDYLDDIEDNIDTIKQALLKAQEPKQYLKWEDLEFEEEGQETLVLLNGTKYRMYYYKGYDECINLFTEDETSVIHIFDGCYSQDKHFFNDLRLERAEE